MLLAQPALASDNFRTHNDQQGDAVIRRTDPGADAPFDPQDHRLIDLLRITLGNWTPQSPMDDLFTGEFQPTGDFLRLDIVLEGLVNPPGNADPLGFDPFVFGPNPIYGFVEIDMDRDVWTGGELAAPQYRYVGNVVRFGGRPLDERFTDRVALDAGAFDDDIRTPPLVDRAGEEFHLALLGAEFQRRDLQEIEGNGDPIFGEGETWRFHGPYFHRAHGYEAFSFAIGGNHDGEYAPASDLQFHHDLKTNETTISLVFPFTNVGAGLIHDEPPGPINSNPSDHASLLEALSDLQSSADYFRMFPTGLPEEDIIVDWAEFNPAEFLDPSEWVVTALLGTSGDQPEPSGMYLVWTDVFPDVILADVDGDGEREDEDGDRIVEFIAAEDGADGLYDGRVVIADFALDFSVFDLTYDGIVDGLDVAVADAEGDADGDDDVDLEDFAQFQRCFSLSALTIPECVSMAIAGNETVALDDLEHFVEELEGPEHH